MSRHNKQHRSFSSEIVFVNYPQLTRPINAIHEERACGLPAELTYYNYHRGAQDRLDHATHIKIGSNLAAARDRPNPVQWGPVMCLLIPLPYMFFLVEFAGLRSLWVPVVKGCAATVGT
jgi:hypothetical protein